MWFSAYTPPPPVGDFVERFWLCSDHPRHPRERILPSGTIELVVNLTEDEVRIYDAVDASQCKRLPGIVVSGPYSTAFVIDPAQHALMMGVHFKPGGAYRFFGAVVRELADSHVALEKLWGPTAVELRDRLGAASTAEERFALMEKILLTRWNGGREHHAAVPIALDALARSCVGISVQDVVRQVGLSQRRFIQVFTEQVGLTPKLFSRVLRFQQARKLAGCAVAPDWALVALNCGYYDQSHLIRDFSQFSGTVPSEYLRLRSDRVLLNHLPVGE